jgi:hypothetical protein
MKRIITTSIIMLLAMTSLLAAGGRNSLKAQNDSTTFIEVIGKLVDSNTEAPVVFATVAISGTSIATVSNTEGEFVLKIPSAKVTGTIAFTHLGYENTVVNIADLKGSKKQIRLKAVALPIDEVIIRNVNPKELILAALAQIKNNYSETPEMQTSFYREAIKQNRKYVSVSEAVLDIYKAGYKSSFDYDRIKIYKGRKSSDVKKMDTLIVKLQGGPKTSLMLDVAKNPGDILSEEMLDYYEFKLTGITTIDNRETYMVHFDQLDGVEYPLYSGNIYIDIETKAIAGLDFQLSDRGLPFASEILIKKKPANLNIDVLNGHYLVRYRKDADNWYLNYVRSELVLESKWKRKLFKNDYNIMLEMAITDRDKANLDKFTNRASVKLNDVFADQVSSFEDDNFWGDHNTIKPDESIEVAIEKLNKKLKRHQ